MLNVLFGHAPGDAYDLLRNHEAYEGRIPAELLAVGNDPGGNLICLAVRGGKRGAVYFWDHEGEGPPGEAGYSNVYPVAESFGEFIESLEAEDTEES